LPTQVGLFEALARGPTTIEDLAKRRGIHRRTIARRILRLSRLGHDNNDRFWTGEISQRC
jgi:DNA-binding IclR family transcriptional regulator